MGLENIKISPLTKHTFFKGDSYQFKVEIPISQLESITPYKVTVNISPLIDLLDRSPYISMNSADNPTRVSKSDVGEKSEIVIKLDPSDFENVRQPLLYYKIKLSDDTEVRTISTGMFIFQSLMGDYYLQRFRKFLKDDPSINKGEFLNAIENTDEDLMSYLNMAVEAYNDSFFRTEFTIDYFKNEMLLFVGALLSALTSNGVLSARCALSYQDMGGVVVQDMDRYGRYLQMFNQFYNYWKSTVLESKRSWNLNNAFGEVSSDMIWGGFEHNNILPIRGRERDIV